MCTGLKALIGLGDTGGSASLLASSAAVSSVTACWSMVLPSTGAALGLEGGINALANVAPKQCVTILKQVKKGNLDAARDLQLKMIPVNQAVTATYGVPGLKAAMDMLGYFGGDPRPPLLPSSDREKSEIRQILLRAGLLPN